MKFHDILVMMDITITTASAASHNIESQAKLFQLMGKGCRVVALQARKIREKSPLRL